MFFFVLRKWQHWLEAVPGLSYRAPFMPADKVIWPILVAPLNPPKGGKK